MSRFENSNGGRTPEFISRVLSIHRSTPHIWLVAVAMFLLLGTLPVLAQVATGDILGTVTDGTGSVVPGANVKLENIGTHEVRNFTTKGDGGYTFSALQPGTYTITVGSPNFKTFSATDVVLAAADRVRIDPALQLGSVNERVEVSATPTSLQTDSTTVGSTITEKTLIDAPLNGRNYVGLVQVQAGVNAGSPNSLSSGSNIVDRRLSSSVSANGQEELFNNNQLDGLDNNSRTIGTLLLRPSVEAISEVRTDINLYTAEVGRTGGAAINVISKAGDNHLHGSVYEFFRNDITDARNFFAPASLLSHKPEQRQNQYGASLSGPIFRDRTFFFVDYDGLRLINGNNSVYTSTVPTVAEQATPGYLGDIKNPFTGAAVATIPTASLDPTALAYFKLFPLPNQFGSATSNGTVNNFLYNPSASLYSSLGDLRIDHHFSQKDTVFGRYSYNRTQAFTPPYLPAANGVQAGGIVSGTLPGNNLTTAHNGQFGYTHVFTPSLLLELRAGYTYFNLDTTPLNFGRNLNDTAPYLIPNANECNLCSGLATLSLVGFAGLGDSISQPFYNQEHNTQFSGALTYTHGHQTLKAGAALIRRNFSFQLPLYPKGLFVFAPTAVAATGTYIPTLQKLLTGTQYITMRQLLLVKPYDRTYEPSGYFQDDWRVRPNLTLNLGVRYDVYTKPNEKNGNTSNFNLSTFSLINSATGGLQDIYTDFSPRFGFDATIAPGTVLRGGFGLTFFPGDSNNSLVFTNPPVGFNSGTVIHAGPLSTSGIGAVPTTVSTTLSGGLSAKPLHQTDSYLEQFNLLLQKEYRGTVFTAGYVAELGRHIVDSSPNIDLPDPQGPVAAGTAAPALRYATQLPNVTGINFFGNFGASSYHSGQVSVERRTSHGLTANLNYTFAHNLDDVLQVFSGDGLGSNGFGLLPNKVSQADFGNSPLDIKHRFAGFFSYDIPTGKSGPTFYKALAGGFRLNGLGFWQAGAPFTVTDATTQANGLARINLPTITADKPNVVGPFSSGGPLTRFFNTAAFAGQPIGTAGNESRNQIFGPHLRRGDLSLFKTIPVREGVKLELRAECFNFTNTPNFAQPNAVIAAYGANGVPLTTNGLGSITSTAYGYSGRQFQFAGRFSF
jgi:hypothetical protein